MDYHPHARDYGSHLPHGSLSQPHRRRPSLLSEFQPGSERYTQTNILWLPQLLRIEILSIQSCPFMAMTTMTNIEGTFIQNAALGKHLVVDIKSCFVTAHVNFTLHSWLKKVTEAVHCSYVILMQ